MAMVENGRGKLGFLCWNPIRRRFDPDAPFFASGNLERELLAKQVALYFSENEKYQLQNMEDVEGRYLNGFEDYYHARHTACCSVCSRVYPTSRLLSIHVSEARDSFFQAKVAHGYPMYECLVEGCEVKLQSYKSHQQHPVDKHKFLASFEFFKKGHLSKKQRQKQHKPREIVDHKSDEHSKMEVDETVYNLVSAVSKLSTSGSTPSNVSVGHRHTRGLTFVPRPVSA